MGADQASVPSSLNGDEKVQVFLIRLEKPPVIVLERPCWGTGCRGHQGLSYWLHSRTESSERRGRDSALFLAGAKGCWYPKWFLMLIPQLRGTPGAMPAAQTRAGGLGCPVQGSLLGRTTSVRPMANLRGMVGPGRRGGAGFLITSCSCSAG